MTACDCQPDEVFDLDFTLSQSRVWLADQVKNIRIADDLLAVSSTLERIGLREQLVSDLTYYIAFLPIHRDGGKSRVAQVSRRAIQAQTAIRYKLVSVEADPAAS